MKTLSTVGFGYASAVNGIGLGGRRRESLVRILEGGNFYVPKLPIWRA